MATKPKWTLGETIQSGKAGGKLLDSFVSRLTKRLEDEKFAVKLAANVSLLEQKGSARSVAKSKQVSATETQLTIAADGAKWVSSMRKAIRRTAGGDPAVLKGFGIGQTVRARIVSSVRSGIAVVLQGAEDHPAALQAAGVLPEDLEQGRQFAVDLTAADTVQEGAKVSAVLSTTERNRIRVDVETAVDRLIAIAEIEFRDEPDVLAQFRALVPGHGPKSGPPSVSK